MIQNEGSIDATSRLFKVVSTPGPGSGERLDMGSDTYFGLQAATVALGHAPTTINDAYIKSTSEDLAGVDSEYIQYDQLFIQTTVIIGT